MSERDAFIYLPGLAHGESDLDLDDVVLRLRSALDRQAPRASTLFGSREAEPVSDSAGEAISRCVTITARDADEDEGREVADVYFFDYRPLLRDRYTSKAPLAQVAALILLLFGSTLRFLRYFMRPGKSAAELFQLAFAGLVLGCIALYVVIVLLTVLGTLGEHTPLWTQLEAAVEELAAAPADATTTSETATSIGSEAASAALSTLDRTLRVLQTFVVLLTGGGYLVRGNLKETISAFTIEYSAVIDYLSSGRSRDAIEGALQDLLQRIAESRGDDAYVRIWFLAYSFGSVVAINALFRGDAESATFRRVGGLITIGSPFDVVRNFWPGYFEARRQRPASLRWLNVHNPDDVLSSCFGEAGRAAPEAGVVLRDGELVAPENLAWAPQPARTLGAPIGRLDRIASVHQSYWGGGDPRAQTCLDAVVPRLGAATPTEGPGAA